MFQRIKSNAHCTHQWHIAYDVPDHVSHCICSIRCVRAYCKHRTIANVKKQTMSRCDGVYACSTTAYVKPSLMHIHMCQPIMCGVAEDKMLFGIEIRQYSSLSESLLSTGVISTVKWPNEVSLHCTSRLWPKIGHFSRVHLRSTGSHCPPQMYCVTSALVLIQTISAIAMFHSHFLRSVYIVRMCLSVARPNGRIHTTDKSQPDSEQKK